jgi:hypothetical protein
MAHSQDDTNGRKEEGMNLKEAREKATPGPFAVGDAGWTIFGAMPKDDPKYPKPYPPIVAAMHGGNRRANSNLLAHCFNHFDEVVAALEEEHLLRCGHPEERRAALTAGRCRTCAVLARAKNVEGM